MKSDIYSGFCGVVFWREAVYICEYGFELERVVELFQIHFAKEVADALHCLTQVRGHRGFAITGISFIIDAHLHSGSGLARIRRHSEGMSEQQLIRLEAQLHLSRSESVDIESATIA